jgi:Holliday junction resolvase RusA-like endonuclease
MIVEFSIPGEFPGLNEIIDAAKSHFGVYATMKETYTDAVHWMVKQAPKLTRPVEATITWYAKDKRRDPDNVMAGQKFIFDGLVKAGVIPNDTWRYIKGITHRFEIDRKNPRVEVRVEEVELIHDQKAEV